MKKTYGNFVYDACRIKIDVHVGDDLDRDRIGDVINNLLTRSKCD